MEIIQAKYIGFNHRLFFSSGFYFGLAMFIILELFISNKYGFHLNYTLIIHITIIFILSIFSFLCYRKSKYYISKFELKDQSIILSIYLLNRKLESIEISYSELIIDLNKNLYEKFPRYTLELKSNSPLDKTGNEFSIKQYEIGFWNKKNLKNVYNLINEKKAKLTSKPH
jgi:hypothetical protein